MHPAIERRQSARILEVVGGLISDFREPHRPAYRLEVYLIDDLIGQRDEAAGADQSYQLTPILAVEIDWEVLTIE